MSIDLPTGGALTIDPGAGPSNTRGWHVFIGFQDGEPTRQNEVALPLGIRGHRRLIYVMTLLGRMQAGLITTSATRARSREDNMARISTMATSALTGHL